MVTNESKTKMHKSRLAMLSRDNKQEPLETKVLKDNGDGTFLLTSRKNVPTKLKAYDYSVQMVLNTAPELMNEKFVLHNSDKVRVGEEFEKAAQAAKDVKDYVDSLPVVEPDVDPNVESSNV